VNVAMLIYNGELNLSPASSCGVNYCCGI